MNNIQSILSIGSIVLLAMASLNFNSSVLQNSTVDTENSVVLTAFSLADDMLEIMKEKAFDAATVDFPTTNPLDLTAPSGLGHNQYETFETFNDVDDFNGYTRYITAPHAEDYFVSCKVEYVDQNNPDKRVNYQTFFKRATITVTSPYLHTPVQVSYIFTLK